MVPGGVELGPRNFRPSAGKLSPARPLRSAGQRRNGGTTIRGRVKSRAVFSRKSHHSTGSKVLRHGRPMWFEKWSEIAHKPAPSGQVANAKAKKTPVD